MSYENTFRLHKIPCIFLDPLNGNDYLYTGFSLFSTCLFLPCPGSMATSIGNGLFFRVFVFCVLNLPCLPLSTRLHINVKRYYSVLHVLMRRHGYETTRAPESHIQDEDTYPTFRTQVPSFTTFITPGDSSVQIKLSRNLQSS